MFATRGHTRKHSLFLHFIRAECFNATAGKLIENSQYCPSLTHPIVCAELKKSMDMAAKQGRRSGNSV